MEKSQRARHEVESRRRDQGAPRRVHRERRASAAVHPEAQLLAQLHHPNIATVFGLEESNGTRALVMELIDGQDSSARIAQGRSLLGEALPIAKQIAEALSEAAHEHGSSTATSSRPTLKSARTEPSRCSTSLAKALIRRARRLLPASTDTHGSRHTHGRFSARPPIWPRAGARGKAADRRADIWAFGVVLFEMLAGRRAFAGDATSDVLAAVLLQEIDWSALPAGTPPRLRWLLERCLERNPRQRLRDMGEARVALDELAQDASHKADARVTPAGVMSAVRARAGRPMTVVSAVVLLALGFALGRFAGRPAGLASAAAPVAFERLTFQAGHFVNARFGPDGQTVFLSAAWRGGREVFQVRPQAHELPVGLANAELLSVSRSGELALLLPRVETGNPYVSYGTLAVVSASGGHRGARRERLCCRLGAGRRESGGTPGRRKQAAVGIPSGDAALRVGVPGLRPSCVASRRQRGLFRAGHVGPVVGRRCRSFRPAADSVEGLGRLLEPGVVA